MPSSSDSGTTGNPLFDYYWGTELYPRVFGVDIKVFTNCRFGMTVWGLLVAICALKNYQVTVVATVVQIVVPIVVAIVIVINKNYYNYNIL